MTRRCPECGGHDRYCSECGSEPPAPEFVGDVTGVTVRYDDDRSAGTVLRLKTDDAVPVDIGVTESMARTLTAILDNINTTRLVRKCVEESIDDDDKAEYENATGDDTHRDTLVDYHAAKGMRLAFGQSGYPDNAEALRKEAQFHARYVLDDDLIKSHEVPDVPDVSNVTITDDDEEQ